LRKIDKIIAIEPKHAPARSPPYWACGRRAGGAAEAHQAIEMNDRSTPQIGRRAVLGLAAIGLAAVAGSAALRGRHVQEAEAEHQAGKPRYRVTQDVEAFYRVNRY
jgi:hypothetical protein